MSTMLNSPTPNGYGKLYTVIKEFNARLGDELTIKPGDTVELISDDSEFDDGWYMGRNVSTNKAGLYPKVFTVLQENQEALKPNLLRSRSRRMTPTGSPVTPNSPSINHFPSVEEQSTLYSNDTSINTTMDTANITSNDTSQINNKGDEIVIDGPQSSNTDGDVNRYVSVHRTMNDIDKALEELNVDSDNTNNQPSSALDPADVELWTPEQVTQYFSYLNFDIESACQFARHKISGAILIQLELSFLKELDIASFGTRFEIYKEIEELRLASKNRGIKRENFDSSVSSARVAQQRQPGAQSPSTTTQGHMRKRSQSMDDIPTHMANKQLSSNGENQRPMSVISALPRPVMPSSNSTTPSNDSSIEEEHEEGTSPPGLFESPRRPPQPPKFSSPVANQTFKFGAGSATPSTSRYNIENHRRSFMDGVHSRDSSIGNSSSIYPDARHSRTTSSLSFTPSNKRESSPTKSHFRNVSDANVPKNNTSSEQPTHRRYSSLLSYGAAEREHVYGRSPTRSPVRKPEIATARDRQFSGGDESPVKLNNSKSTALSPKRRSMSAKESSSSPKAKDPKRIASAAVVPTNSSTSRTTSSTFRSLATRRGGKTTTSAFQEGIRTISTDEAIKTADFSGWMSKRGNMAIGSWKQRYFTLHKTRLSYYTSLKDNREKGLIDITSHRVLPAQENEDKISAVYAATTGSGRYCFKLVPPAPGSRKGLTFTQQKVHYFAVETKQEMRNWMGALMKATIELDESVPVISSCVTPTIPLQKAQELMAITRENARQNLERLHKEQQMQLQFQENTTTEEEESVLSTNNSNTQIPTPTTQPSSHFQTGTPTSHSPMRRTSMKIDISSAQSTSLDPSSSSNGMSTPYLVTSGLISPNTSSTTDLHSPTTGRRTSLKRTPTASTNPVPMITKLDGNDSESTNGANNPALSAAVGAMGRRMMSLRKTSNE
ncbi:hypothetical protein CANARDRAFT_9525 [[Candida] arabinofermentans NRRL YB-2248]|uniref:PH domain-containing protein n=1 Tax=[Candida] arabinofermentans NRRL YB-2248 TaxID=983967 RepID=A0A1E4SVD3_9ASCO|nr:hypothetical protein CANARDRAFT_9525 [[Candida] arabinofermentans NRRL YB-2248]